MAGWHSAGQGTTRADGPRLWVGRSVSPFSSLTWAIQPVLGVKPWWARTCAWMSMYVIRLRTVCGACLDTTR